MHKSCGKEKEMFRDTEKETYFLPQLVFIMKFTDWGKVHYSKGKKMYEQLFPRKELNTPPLQLTPNS